MTIAPAPEGAATTPGPAARPSSIAIRLARRPLAVIGLVIIGFLAGPIDVSVLSVRQRRTDPGWFGRVLAVSMSLNMSGLPLGSALGGLVVTTSPHLAFAIAAFASIVAGLAACWLIPERESRAG